MKQNLPPMELNEYTDYRKTISDYMVYVDYTNYTPAKVVYVHRMGDEDFLTFTGVYPIKVKAKNSQEAKLLGLLEFYKEQERYLKSENASLRNHIDLLHKNLDHHEEKTSNPDTSHFSFIRNLFRK